MQTNEQGRLNVHSSQDSLIKGRERERKHVNQQKELKCRIIQNEFIVNMLQAINITLLSSSSGSFESVLSFHEFGALYQCMQTLYTFRYMHEEWWISERAMLYVHEHWAFYSKHSIVKLDECGAWLTFFDYSLICLKIYLKVKMTTRRQMKGFHISEFFLFDKDDEIRNSK